MKFVIRSPIHYQLQWINARIFESVNSERVEWSGKLIPLFPIFYTNSQQIQKKRMIHSLSDIWNASCINALSFHWIKFQVYVCVCIRIIVYLTASVGTHTHIRLLALDIHSEAVPSISLCKTVVGISLWIEIFPRFFIWEKEWENYLKKRIFTLLTSV